MNAQPRLHRTAGMLAAALTALSLLSGCVSAAPDYASRFGEAVRYNRQAQVLNPGAAENQDLAAGLDGGSAREAIQRYQDSFKSPPPVVEVINIGGSVGGR